MDTVKIRWTDYMQYRTRLRRFDLAAIEDILRYSGERYVDAVTGRRAVVGRHGEQLVMIPYDHEGDVIIPVTIHVTSRQQVAFRLKLGRFQNA